MYQSASPRPEKLRNDRLARAILSLQPSAFWPFDDASGALREASGRNLSAAVTGTPVYRVRGREPFGMGITWSGTGQYAESPTSVATPTSSVSVLIAYRGPSAATYPISRNDPSQSWAVTVSGAGATGFIAYQSGGAVHASVDSTGVVNDNVTINLFLGTFDGTAIRAYGQTSPSGQSSASLTGSWQKATSKVTVGAYGFGAGLFAGTTYLAAYWSDRVLTQATYRHLLSVAYGG